MPKSRNVIANKATQNAHFHWEFLRRSAKYRTAFDNFKEQFPEWIKNGMDPSWPYLEAIKKGDDVRNPSAKSFTARAYGEHQAFETKWGIGPTDPDTKHSPFLWRGTISVIDYGPATEHWAADSNVLTLCINTRGPVSEVMSQLEFRIRHHKEENESKNANKMRIHRKRFDKFPAYIAAHDAMSEGKTDREVADQLNLDDEKVAFEFRKRAIDLILRAQRGEW